jgi:vacuolar-type H+-ATPase subunit E/Vma4
MQKQAVEENIDALSRAILSEAQAEADKVLADARAKADAIRQRAQAQADDARREILDRASQEAERLRSQKIATAQLKARTMQLDHREKLLDRVFKMAQQELPAVQQWSDYEEITKNLLREALTQLHAKEVQVQADRQTEAILSHASAHFLQDIAKELDINIKMGEPLQQGIGVVVETTDGHVQYDNTLQTRLHRMQNALRSPIYHILMGEAL